MGAAFLTTPLTVIVTFAATAVTVYLPFVSLSAVPFAFTAKSADFS